MAGQVEDVEIVPAIRFDPPRQTLQAAAFFHDQFDLLPFLREAALGKTVIGKAKKKIGPARLLGYVAQLYPLILFVRKNLDDVSQEEMEAFIEALEADAIRSRSPRVEGQRQVASGRRLSERYKVDIKITVKKFYKWLLSNSKTYPPLVEWIDTYVEPKEIPALTPDEVQRMVDRSRTAKQRALIQVLFDGGLRIGELLNIRLQRALGKRVYPHLLRHTSATFWSNRLPYFRFCKRFGWTMTSKMPQRYIDRSGLDETDVARIYTSEVTDKSTFQSPVLPSRTRLHVPVSGALQLFPDEQRARHR